MTEMIKTNAAKIQIYALEDIKQQKNKIYSVDPIDKTRIYPMKFLLMEPGRKTQEGVPCSPQWDGFL